MEEAGMQGPPKPEYKPLFTRTLDKVWDFIDLRLGTDKWALRPQPDWSFKPAYWTGGLVATAFIFQVISGLLLLLYYVPSTDPATAGGLYLAGTPMAWASTYYIIHSVPMGAYLLSVHLYGAYATIFLAFLHFFRGFYTGVYKRPREVTWMVGTLLLLAMLGMGFTGYLLPYTALSVGATDVGINITLQAPMGPMLVSLLLGNGSPQGLLSRFFAAHVVIIPLALAGLLYAHVSLFETHGIAPRSSSDPKAKRVLTHEDDKKMTGKFFPKIFLYMTKWAMFYAGILLIIAAVFPWQLPTYYGSPTSGGVSPEPDWYFLWLYKFMDFQYQLPGGAPTDVQPIQGIGVTTVIIAFVLFLPWIDREPFTSKKTHPRDRPVIVIIGNFLAGFFLVMTVWGGVMPGVLIPPIMVVEYIAPLVVVNMAVVFLLYWRYRRSYSRRVWAREHAKTKANPNLEAHGAQ